MNTYAKIFQCSTVRLILVMRLILDLKKQITDSSNAFDQAELVNPVYITTPDNYCQH